MTRDAQRLMSAMGGKRTLAKSRSTPQSLRLKPPLLLIPAGGLGEALVGLDARVPEVGRREAAGADYPIGMAEIGRPVQGQFGAAAANPAVDPGGKAHQHARSREADIAPTDGLPKRFGKFLVTPTTRR